MIKNMVIFIFLAFSLVTVGCAPKKAHLPTQIQTKPPGATVTIDGIKSSEVTPFPYTFNFAPPRDYTINITKEGFFEEEFIVNKQTPDLKKGELTYKLTRSPLWEATVVSPATNTWIQVLVGADLNAKMAWQIMIDAVIKRSSNIKELNYESGYLQTKYTVRKFDTKNGEFLLRCQLIATLVSSEPLIYRIKDVAEWSGNGVQWHPYNRIFIEHSDMITEIQDRLRSN